MRLRRFAVAFSLLAATGCGQIIHTTPVSLPEVFSNNMVLQRNATVPVWGTAGKGEEISVEFQGQKKTAIAEDGRWRVAFENLKPGGPYTMTVSGSNTIVFDNVLVGEVWVCGGQSNMAWKLMNSEGGKDEIAAGDNPAIRLLAIPSQAGGGRNSLGDESGWRECTSETKGNFSGVGYFFGKAINEALGVPVGLISNAVGGTSAVQWIPKEALDANPDLAFYKEDLAHASAVFEANKPAIMEKYEQSVRNYEEDLAKAKANGTRAPGRPSIPRDPAVGNRRPGGLFETLTVPLVPYAIQGVIWYQGESDTGRGEQYHALFSSMIGEWRKAWGQGDFPFLFVQLAAYRGNAGRGDESLFKRMSEGWPRLRESQLKTLAVKNTAMAVAIDLGEEMDIHPRNKKSVGERLALAARATVYGEDIVYSGPIYKSSKVENGKVQIAFDHIGSGLASGGGDLRGFAIAGEDGKFVPAQARIEEKRVIVSSPEVPDPAYARYGWDSFTDCNLYNKEGLPASPFRTDDLPMADFSAATPGR
jgi:sialate O-acetylesterase